MGRKMQILLLLMIIVWHASEAASFLDNGRDITDNASVSLPIASSVPADQRAREPSELLPMIVPKSMERHAIRGFCSPYALRSRVEGKDRYCSQIVNKAERLQKRGRSSPSLRKSKVRRYVCDKDQREHVAVESAQQKVPYFPRDVYLKLEDHVYPEAEVSVSVKRFLKQHKFLKPNDIGSYQLRVWLHQPLCTATHWVKDFLTYPFPENLDSFRALCPILANLDCAIAHVYSKNIESVMRKLLSIFCWEWCQESQPLCAMPGWEKEENYPNMKAILRSWKQGPFPDSFCGNIIFLMENKERLQHLGCDMHFLEGCCRYLPPTLRSSMSVDVKYKDFYESVFRNIECCKQRIVFLDAGSQNYQEYIQSYREPCAMLLDFQEKIQGKLSAKRKAKPAAMWLCELALQLMVAEVILGKKPELVISIQGIAAYINDQLEYVQFHPDCFGMNTETLNALVITITEGKGDMKLCKDYVVEEGVIRPLNRKMHGLKWGLHPFCVNQGWVLRPAYYTSDTQAFRKTKAVMGALRRWGVPMQVVKSLKSSMGKKGVMPSSLYHDPLTDKGLNAFLKQCGKRSVVCTPLLNIMSKTVESLVLDEQLAWKESTKVDYEHYEEFFAYNRDITKDDLVALEKVIWRNEQHLLFENLCPFHPNQFQSMQSMQNPLMLAMRAYIAGSVLPKMIDEKYVVLRDCRDMRSLAAKLHCRRSGKKVWRTEVQESHKKWEEISSRAHAASTAKEKAKILKKVCIKIPYSAREIEADKAALQKQKIKRYADFQRKVQILDFLCARMSLESENCLFCAPINMSIMFLRALGVMTPPFAYTMKEVRDVAAALIDGSPLKDDKNLYDIDLSVLCNGIGVF